VARLAGAQREAETCCLYNDERSQEADRECVASSGLKNWPTAMTAEGGGIPETGCNMPIKKIHHKASPSIFPCTVKKSHFPCRFVGMGQLIITHRQKGIPVAAR
jgi:hypothetical protein